MLPKAPIPNITTQRPAPLGSSSGVCSASERANMLAITRISEMPRRPSHDATMPETMKPMTMSVVKNSRLKPIPSGPRPATSLSHGPAHSPPKARLLPAAQAATGARRQNSRSR